jgi:O-antigen ligase
MEVFYIFLQISKILLDGKLKIELTPLKKDQVLNILFLLWAAILPWSLAGMQIIMVLLVLTSIIFAISQGTSPIKFHPFYIFTGIYLLAGMITVLTVDNSYNALISAFNNDWVILCVPFIASIYLAENWMKKVIIVLIISAAISGLYGIVQFFDGFDYIRNKALSPLSGFFRSTGGYSSWFALAGNQLFVFSFAFTFGSILKTNTRLSKLAYFSAPVIFLSIIGSQTRSVWIAITVVILLGTFLKSKKYFIYALISLSLISMIAFIISPDIQERFMSIFSFSKNEGRINIWHTSWNIFKENWLVGVGHGNFDFYFDKFRVPGFYDAQGHAHNDYLNVAVLNGVIGLVTWVAMWAAWFYYTIQAYRSPEYTDLEKSILLSAILGITGILIASFFQCYYTDLENNIFWWFIASMALQIIVRSSNKDQAHHPD